jgi:hypothetical protein
MDVADVLEGLPAEGRQVVEGLSPAAPLGGRLSGVLLQVLLPRQFFQGDEDGPDLPFVARYFGKLLQDGQRVGVPPQPPDREKDELLGAR